MHARTGIDVRARAWEHTLASSNTPPQGHYHAPPSVELTAERENVLITFGA